MGKLLKTVGFIFLALVVLIVAAYFFGQSMGGGESLEKGYAYGKAHDLRACFGQTRQQLGGCFGEQACMISAMGFARGCTAKASYSQSFCRTIPLDNVGNSLKWVMRQCKDHPHPKGCGKSLVVYADACRKKAAK
ncbi:MAG: hypothetical protein OXT65_02690 [Alphaproteobacteria bacterium]|nr:hypothetical protein [Alphaproteobacteria bacterium]